MCVCVCVCGVCACGVCLYVVGIPSSYSEKMIALSILRLIEWEKAVVEGAGATGLAACMSPQLLDKLRGKKLVTPVPHHCVISKLFSETAMAIIDL